MHLRMKRGGVARLCLLLCGLLHCCSYGLIKSLLFSFSTKTIGCKYLCSVIMKHKEKQKGQPSPITLILAQQFMERENKNYTNMVA